jgi:hypothetical protein
MDKLRRDLFKEGAYVTIKETHDREEAERLMYDSFVHQLLESVAYGLFH